MLTIIIIILIICEAVPFGLYISRTNAILTVTQEKEILQILIVDLNDTNVLYKEMHDV